MIDLRSLVETPLKHYRCTLPRDVRDKVVILQIFDERIENRLKFQEMKTLFLRRDLIEALNTSRCVTSVSATACSEADKRKAQELAFDLRQLTYAKSNIATHAHGLETASELGAKREEALPCPDESSELTTYENTDGGNGTHAKIATIIPGRDTNENMSPASFPN